QGGVVGRVRPPHGHPGPLEQAEGASQRDRELHADRVERVLAQVVPEQRLVPKNQRPVRAHGSSPVAIGRVGSATQLLQEPTYSAGSARPATLSGRPVWGATTPEPQ